jgi:hypothetical protein
MADTLPNSPYLDMPLRSEHEVRAERAVNELRGEVEDERVALALQALPKVAELCALIKPIADKIGRHERRFGTTRIKGLAKLIDDLWMACDNYASDVPDMRGRP